MRFSARLLASKGEGSLVFSDAPRPTRIGYIKGVLNQFVGRNNRLEEEELPLEVNDTHRKFCALIRDEADPWDYDSQDDWSALTTHLKDCTWGEYFDFVELVGRLLKQQGIGDPFSVLVSRHFPRYKSLVNDLHREDHIGWMLNDSSELQRQIPASLARRVGATEQALTGSFSAARVHYQKAVRYLYQHPIDESNSVKEIVSAIESVARVLEPNSSTLGDAIKALRKQDTYAKHLLDGVEKIYVYSNATPQIRHGHPDERRMSVAEAELALHVGVAFIRYLVAHRDQGG